MAECDSHNMYQNLNPIPLSPNISNDQQFRLNKINEIKDYFIADTGVPVGIMSVRCSLLLSITRKKSF